MKNNGLNLIENNKTKNSNNCLMDSKLKQVEKIEKLMQKRNKLFKLEVAAGISTVVASTFATACVNDRKAFIMGCCVSGTLAISTFALVALFRNNNYKINYEIAELGSLELTEYIKSLNKKRK